jgi:hypothetical protein
MIIFIIIGIKELHLPTVNICICIYVGIYIYIIIFIGIKQLHLATVDHFEPTSKQIPVFISVYL